MPATEEPGYEVVPRERVGERAYKLAPTTFAPYITQQLEKCLGTYNHFYS